MNEGKMARLIPIRKQVFRDVSKIGFREAASLHNVGRTTLVDLAKLFPDDYRDAMAEQGKEVHMGEQKARSQTIWNACKSVKETLPDQGTEVSAKEEQPLVTATAREKRLGVSKNAAKNGGKAAPRGSSKKNKKAASAVAGNAVDAANDPTENELRIQALMDKAVVAERKLRKSKTETVYYTVELGFYLLRVRSVAEHGEWENQVRERCLVPPRTARRYVELAENLFPDDFLKSATVADLDAEIPPEVAKQVKNNIGGDKLTELYEKYDLTQKASTPKLPKKARFLEFLELMGQNLKEHVQAQTDPAAAEKATGLISKLSECEGIVDEYYELMGESKPRKGESRKEKP